MFIKKVI